MDTAIQLYERAIACLQQADETAGAEVQAEKLLRQAADALLQPEIKRRKRKQNGVRNDDDEKQMFLVEIYLMLGKIIEWKEPNIALIEYMNAHRICPNSPATNYNVARLVWKQASTISDMEKAEEHLRATIKYAEEDEDEEAEFLWDNGMELLARLLCQSGKSRWTEALAILKDLRYKYVFQSHLTSGLTMKIFGGKNRIADPNFVAAFDKVLPPELFRLMADGLQLGANFWKDNLYGDPRTGFFSFQHKLPRYEETLKAHQHNPITPGPSGLDQVLQHIWIVASKAMPEVKKATYVEWWAHSRQHCYGHQIHYDSIPGVEQGKPKHPIISTITFLSAECGGSTLITNQTIDNSKTSKGWVAHPKTNRLICFNGSALHLVLPGKCNSKHFITTSISCTTNQFIIFPPLLF